MGKIQTLKILLEPPLFLILGFSFLVLRPIYERKFRYLATSLQVHVTTLYTNEYLPVYKRVPQLPAEV